MEVTPSGMVSSPVKPLHFAKAELPMEVKAAGRVSEVKPLQMIEGVPPDGGDALGNGERAGEAAALIEGVVADGGDASRE